MELMEVLTTIFIVVGGLGLFLYGMKMMSNGLEIIAGDKMQGILHRATSNRFLAVAVGFITTVIIQSSSATTVMTVSFVNSGMLSLTQAIGIIMGANVGTTFTAQLIAFKIDTVAPLFIFIGVIMNLFFKKRKINDIGYVMLGFGVLFFGLSTMGVPLKELAQKPELNSFLISFDNPILALLAGLIFTAVIQSSSATTGILVTLHLSGVPIPFQTSAFIILGTNIGSCVTAAIASLTANRESKRAAFFHMFYNIIGNIVFGSLILIFPAILTWFQSAWTEPARQVAMFHTLYNSATLILLIPFVKYIVVSLQKIFPLNPDSEIDTYEKKLMYLNTIADKPPAVTVINAHLELCRMGKIASENFSVATDAFFTSNIEKVKKTLTNEKVIDYLNHKIASKLVAINGMKLTPPEAEKIGKMFLILSDIERIGDHAVNIAEYAKAINSGELKFSETAVNELKTLAEQVKKMTVKALEVYDKQDNAQSPEIKLLGKEIKKLSAKFVNNHIERMKNENCQPESGVIFTDMIIDLERTADHAKNIANSVSLEKKWNRE